jgi:hypothetical protein
MASGVGGVEPAEARASRVMVIYPVSDAGEKGNHNAVLLTPTYPSSFPRPPVRGHTDPHLWTGQAGSCSCSSLLAFRLLPSLPCSHPVHHPLSPAWHNTRPSSSFSPFPPTLPSSSSRPSRASPLSPHAPESFPPFPPYAPRAHPPSRAGRPCPRRAPPRHPARGRIASFRLLWPERSSASLVVGIGRRGGVIARRAACGARLRRFRSPRRLVYNISATRS